MGQQYFEEKGERTAYLERKAENLAQQKTLAELSEAGSISLVRAMLDDIMSEMVTLGEYVYKYLFTKLSLKGNDYSDITPERYYDIICKEFIKHDMPFRGSLAGKTDLSKIKDPLKRTASQVGREYAFLLAFGLKMSLEDFEMMMKKAFQQPILNIRSWREVIYYYCISAGAGIGDVDRLVAEYEAMAVAIPTEDEEFDIFMDDTRYIKDEYEPFDSEENLRQYLTELKIRSEKAKLKVKKDSFEKYVKKSRSLRNYLFDSEEKGSGSSINSNFVGAIVESTSQGRINALDAYETWELLPKAQAEQIFGKATWTRDSLINKSNGKAEVTRQDVLILAFRDALRDYGEKQRNGRCPNKYLYVMKEVNKALEEMEMYPLYLRNPFDFFLIVCLFHENSDTYFLANWQLAITKTTEE